MSVLWSILIEASTPTFVAATADGDAAVVSVEKTLRGVRDGR